MGVLSSFGRSAEAAVAPPPAEAGGAVQQARTQARRRLIGAVVLLVVGVIGFPLVFETRPRPIPIDIPIEIPKKEGAPALVMPGAPARPSDRTEGGAAAPSASLQPVPREDVITESAADAGREVAGTRPAARAVPTANEGKPAAPEGSRYIVQVGAFAEAEAARQARAKIEKLGLKTYTQVAQTPAGSRIRVRLGPFASRAEADAASAKARAAGLTAVVQTL